MNMYRVLLGMIKAYEIQGVFQEHNAFNRVGLDHTILVKVASTAVVCWLMGLTFEQALSAVSHAWADGHPLRVFRQAPNAGPRKGWAAGDACSTSTLIFLYEPCRAYKSCHLVRAVHLASLASAGQPGLRTVLTDPRWGFYHVLYKDEAFKLPRPFGCWVMENVVFKVTTAEGHGLTAAEAALDIAHEMRKRHLNATAIAKIRVTTQRAAMIIIDKKGPLLNAADRDHCMRYMVAVVLLKGAAIDTPDYQDDSPWAHDPRIADLRSRISMEEDTRMTDDYHNAAVRSCANAIEVAFEDGTLLESRVDFPLGHMRRSETEALVKVKAIRNLGLGLTASRVGDIVSKIDAPEFEQMPVHQFMELLK